MGQSTQPTGERIISADALLEFTEDASARGALCATLTPAVKARLRELETGQVLEIRVDDAAASDDLTSWCRLSGHELLAQVRGPMPWQRFFIRKTHE